MTPKVGIIDYSIGNLYSVAKAIDYVGGFSYFIKSPDELEKAERVILPGVGSYDKCYAELDSRGFIEPLLSYVKSGSLLLGICVGMQLLFTRSSEGAGSKGLGIIQGNVDLINRKNNGQIKLPHVGWSNLLFKSSQRMPLLSNIKSDDEFYFVHSYNANCTDDDAEIIYSNYEDAQITAFVKKGTIFGCQFHPEKSKAAGLKILNNFIIADN